MKRCVPISSKKVTFVVLGVLLPFLLGYLLFWYPETTRLEIKNERTPESNVRVVVIESDNEWIKAATVVREIFQVPFNLASYNICLRNNSRMEGLGGKTFVDVNALITDESGKVVLGPIFLPKQGGSCGTVSIRPFILTIKDANFELNTEFLPGKLQMDLDVAADDNIDAWPTNSNKITSTLIFFFVYFSLLQLMREYLNWYRKSFL